MSEYQDGTERLFKTTKILMNVEALRAFQNLNPDNLTLSRLMNDLLFDYLIAQQLKQEFARLKQ
jgi:hypothetical protein